MIVESELIKIAAWMRKKYGSTMTQALKTVLPVKSKVKSVEKFTVELLLSEEEAKDFLAECERKHYLAKVRLIEQLLVDPKVPKLWITKILNVSSSTLR